MAFSKSIRIDLASNRAVFKQTSSLNSYFLCHYCNKKFISKAGIKGHVFACVASKTCKWCNIQFKNRGNLVTHLIYVHNDKELKLKALRNACQGCDKMFCNLFNLQLHIRREHFNFISKVPLCQSKTVNETWYEKVINSDAIVKMNKVTPNFLLIEKYNGMPVNVEESKDTIDISQFFRTEEKVNKVVTCDICKKKLLARTYKKHYEERHENIQKHHCNNCNKTFKRLSSFCRHQCYT